MQQRTIATNRYDPWRRHLADRPALCHIIRQAQCLGSVTQISVLQPVAFHGWRAEAVTSDGQGLLVRKHL